MKFWAGGLIIGLLATGCASAPPAHPKSIYVKPVSPKALVSLAKKQIGTPYRYGGETPKDGFDCSGLVWWCYQQLGSTAPRSAHTLYAAGHKIKAGDLKMGDLVFFNIGGSPPAHVGIAVDHKDFVHAPSSGGKVRIDSLSNVYWSKHFYGARRIE